jgi:hypothetical protein
MTTPPALSSAFRSPDLVTTIFHNPACATSRNVLALIRNSGDEPEVIEYLKAGVLHRPAWR